MLTGGTSYLIDSSFIQVDRSFIRELSRYLFHSSFQNIACAHTQLCRRARYSRNRTRFVTLPADLDCNSTNTALVNASLTSGLYPKILAIDATNRQMRTITNNQPAAFHPSSVNFRKNVVDFGVHHLSYFTLMWVYLSIYYERLYSCPAFRHSKKLYAWETGPVDDTSMLLLCGECDFKVRTQLLADLHLD